MDPYAVLPDVPARLLSDSILERFTPEMLANLTGKYSDAWSAVGYGQSQVTGEQLILLNPTDHPRRRRVSLMEEIVHIVEGHPRTVLQRDGKGRWTRTFKKGVEDEAFNVGSACIIPYKTLFDLVNHQHRSAAVIAQSFEVSQDYVEYRIRRAGLWRVYKKRSVQ